VRTTVKVLGAIALWGFLGSWGLGAGSFAYDPQSHSLAPFLGLASGTAGLLFAPISFGFASLLAVLFILEDSKTTAWVFVGKAPFWLAVLLLGLGWLIGVGVTLSSGTVPQL
jgi:hypothetical protein